MNNDTKSGTTILLVEDDQLLNKSIQNLLQREGFVTEGFLSGTKALERMAASSGDVLLLLDYTLPDMTGKEVIEKIRERGLDIPFVIITGHGDELLAVEMMKLGAMDYIVKSIQFHEILPAKVKHACEEIENRKKLAIAEDSLRQSEARYRVLFEQAADIILQLEITPEGMPVIRAANSATLRLLGYERDELIGKPVSFINVEPNGSEGVNERRHNVLSGIGTVFEARHRCKNGTVRDFECSVSEMQVGPKTFAISVERDITERKLAEEKIQNLAKFPAENPSPVMRLNRNGAVLYANEASGPILSFWKCKPGIAVPESIKKIVEEVLENGNKHTLEIEVGSKTYLFTMAPFLEGGYVNVYSVDITERKHADQALRDSEEKYRSLVDGANEAILVAQNGMLAFVNHKTAELLGRSEPDLIGKPFPEFIYPDDRKLVVDNYMKRMKGEPVPSRYEFRLLTIDKSAKWVEINSVIINWNGKPATLNFLTDITERKKADDELRHQTALLEAQLNSSMAGILIVDTNGKKILQNRRTVELWKIPQGIADNSDDAAQVQHVMNLTKNPEQFVEKITYLYNHPNETTKDEVELTDGRALDRYSAPVLGKDGENYGRIWTFHDITERKQAEEKLRESEERYRTLFDDAKDGIALADSETGRIVECNQALCAMAGMDKTELVGRMNSVLHPPQNLVKGQSVAFEKHAAGDPGAIVEDQIVSRSGALTPVEIRAARVRMNNHDYMLGIFRDVSERKQHEKEKEKLLSQLLQAQKMEAIGTLAGGVAHDFNNLLTAISGFTTMAMMKIDESDPVQRDLKQVSTAATRAAGLTRQLLLFSRKQHMEPVPMDPNATISRLLKMLERIIGENIAIETNLERELGSILGDEGNIEQVLMNLSVNARDAMPQGGKLFIKTENVTIDDEYCGLNKAARPGRFVCISVSDTGTGMDELTQEHIFEPFFTTKQEGKGTGLGLSVVFGIVQQHEGWLTVYSEPGHGTTFKVYLPSTSKMPGQQGQNDAPLAFLEGKGERIMVVEDQPEVRAIAKEMLMSNGYSVLTASNAQEATELFEKENGRFDLVFSDVVLPDRSGVLLVQDLLKRWKFKVLITSGYTDEKANWDFIKENNFRFLHKPYAVRALLQTVREVLEEKKS